MKIYNQEEWGNVRNWINACEQILLLVTERISNSEDVNNEVDIVNDALFRKGLKHFHAIIILCKEGFGQDAFILSRVLLELFFKMKHLNEPTSKKEQSKRAKQFITGIFSETKTFAENIERDVNASFMTDQVKAKLKQEIQKHGTPDEWPRQTYEIAKIIHRLELYRTEYAYQSLFVHSKALCFDDYADKKNGTFDFSASDSFVQQAIQCGLKYFSFILDIWRHKLHIKKHELKTIIRENKLKL